ncbi:XdhC family protein [Streptomyces sp. 142MFCol3.1]|uniref:XdhC family protein n=1 Tax=Streptomyces sp. 142MFCol3.1 TaxID=1172179 RepID=UPI00042051C1|nr:XdhC/CoxI family protein [Streptomyces sp. 142MFCol3.1]
MLDLAEELHRWVEEGRDFAVATVVAVGGSAPRGPGAALAVDSDGTAIGSVSGGCVEGAVYDLCVEALQDGRVALERFGYSDEDAFAVGLTCGGVLDVLVMPVRADTPALAGWLAAAARGEAVALARMTKGPAELLGGALLVHADGSYAGTLTDGSLRSGSAAAGGLSGSAPGTGPERDALGAGSPRSATPTGPKPDATETELNRDATAVEVNRYVVQAEPERDALEAGSERDTVAGASWPREGGVGAALEATAAAEARAMLDGGRTGTVEISEDGANCPGGVTLFVESSVPPPRMIVFGAVDFAAALVRAGKFLGHHVTVCDARPVFATRNRFPEADEVVVDWPHRYLRNTATDHRTVLCVLTHDAKFDIPLLEAALRLPVAYVGAMGSRRTHEDRERRLREAGLTDRELARLRSPIGLDLGARTPEETALSIAAEIVASRRGGSGVPLTGNGLPIHHDRVTAPVVRAS